jgi:hypothetical protein
MRWVAFPLMTFVLFHLFFFLFHPTRGIFAAISPAVLFPAAVVEKTYVPYSCLANYTNEFAKLYTDESRGKLFDRALGRCVYNAGVKNIADELGVTAEDDLTLAQKTEEAVLAEESFQAEPKKRLETMKQRLYDGVPFGDAARRYSEDVSGGGGGDLGVFYLNAVPAWLDGAARLEGNAISDVLEGSDAYWLVGVSERGGDGEGAWVRLRGIAVKKVTLRKVLDDRARENPPWIFIW